MIIVYALYSESYNRLYIGMTNNLERRLKQHNAGHNFSTKAYRPWAVIYKEFFENRTLARTHEKELKTTSGRRFLRGKISSVD